MTPDPFFKKKNEPNENFKICYEFPIKNSKVLFVMYSTLILVWKAMDFLQLLAAQLL